MLFGIGRESERAVAGAVRDLRAFRVSDLKARKEEAELWRSSGYAAAVAKRRLIFEDMQSGLVKRELTDRYPETGSSMTAFVVPLCSRLWRSRSTGYLSPPRREVLVGGAIDSAATADASEMYARARVNQRMQRAEQIAASCELSFIRAGWNAVMRRHELTPFWPDQVWVVPDPAYPTTLPAARYVIARVASSSGVSKTGQSAAVERYEVWQRLDDGRWLMTVVDSDGSSMMPHEFESAQPVPLLPWIAFPFSLPEGTLYRDPPTDDVDVNMAINVANSDVVATIAAQMFDHLYTIGDDRRSPLIASPGVVLDFPVGSTVGTVSYNPKIAEVRDVLRDMVAQHALLRGVNPSSAVAHPEYMSGYAQEVLKQPEIEARSSRLPEIEEIEQHLLWPLMTELDQQTGRRFPSGAELRWYPGEIVAAKDEESKLRRARGLVELGWSTPVKEMVAMGLAKDLDDAQRQLNENRAWFKANPGNDIVSGTPFVSGAPPVLAEGSRAAGTDEDNPRTDAEGGSDGMGEHR